MKDSVQDCYDFFMKGFPQSGPKNFRTQVGVMFEEIAETVAQFDASKPEDVMILTYLGQVIEQAGEDFENPYGVLGIKDRVEFLDGLCDVMVTAVGLGRHSNMNVPGAFKEVNRSNNSKFAENGEPILDKNLKLIKGPLYTKPDLKSFV